MKPSGSMRMLLPAFALTAKVATFAPSLAAPYVRRPINSLAMMHHRNNPPAPDKDLQSRWEVARLALGERASSTSVLDLGCGMHQVRTVIESITQGPRKWLEVEPCNFFHNAHHTEDLLFKEKGKFDVIFIAFLLHKLPLATSRLLLQHAHLVSTGEAEMFVLDIFPNHDTLQDYQKLDIRGTLQATGEWSSIETHLMGENRLIRARRTSTLPMSTRTPAYLWHEQELCCN